MSIKPVAWMHKDGSVITAEKKKKAERSSSIQGAMVSGYTTPLIPAIPDTHRVVPVELLERCTEQLLEGAEAHQSLNDEFGNSSRIAPGRIACETLSDELRAIINKEPTCPSA